MIDLNVRTLVELCHLVLPAMRERGRGRDLQRRLDRGLPARAEHGGLLCDQGLRPVLHRGAAPRVEGERHQGLGALPRARPTTEFGAVAGTNISSALERITADAASVVRAGLKGLDRNKAVVIPGWTNKATANISRFLPRAAMRRIVGAIKV